MGVDLCKFFYLKHRTDRAHWYSLSWARARTNLVYSQQCWFNMYMYVHIFSVFSSSSRIYNFPCTQSLQFTPAGKQEWMLSLSWTKHHFLGSLLHLVIIDWLLESIIDLGLHFPSFIVLWVSWLCRCSNQVTLWNFQGIRLNLKVIVMVNAVRSVEMRMFGNSFAESKLNSLKD